MQYQTIVLELIRQNDPLHRSLKATGTLLPAVETTAEALRFRHLALMQQLQSDTPESHELQVKSEAFEIALAETADAIAHGLLPSKSETA